MEENRIKSPEEILEEIVRENRLSVNKQLTYAYTHKEVVQAMQIYHDQFKVKVTELPDANKQALTFEEFKVFMSKRIGTYPLGELTTMQAMNYGQMYDCYLIGINTPTPDVNREMLEALKEVIVNWDNQNPLGRKDNLYLKVESIISNANKPMAEKIDWQNELCGYLNNNEINPDHKGVLEGFLLDLDIEFKGFEIGWERK